MVYLINFRIMYTRHFLTPEENVEKNIQFDPTCDLRHTVLRNASVVDEFYRESITNTDGSESVSFLDPIYVLFNQQRLNSLGTTAAQSFLDSLQPQSDSLAELRKKCSDEDLLQMVKSRHLQSPSEILAWCRYMEQNVDTFNREVQTLIEAQKQENSASSNQQTTE